MSAPLWARFAQEFETFAVSAGALPFRRTTAAKFELDDATGRAHVLACHGAQLPEAQRKAVEINLLIALDALANHPNCTAETREKFSGLLETAAVIRAGGTPLGWGLAQKQEGIDDWCVRRVVHSSPGLGGAR
jgi:hypothetical protein